MPVRQDSEDYPQRFGERVDNAYIPLVEVICRRADCDCAAAPTALGPGIQGPVFTGVLD